MASRRRGGSLGDLIRTLVVFTIGVVLLVAFLPRDHQGPVAQPVDYSVPVATLRQVAPFPVYAPVTPPAGWTPQHVQIHTPAAGDPSASLDLGFYIEPTKGYAEVEQSDAAGFTAEKLGAGAKQTGSTVVAGVTWQTWTDAGGRPALVRAVGSSTLVLDGVTGSAQLAELAGALSAAPVAQTTVTPTS